MLMSRLFNFLSVLFYIHPFRIFNCVNGLKETNSYDLNKNNIECIETSDEKNIDPLSKIVGNFIDMTENFWIETDEHLNEYRKRRLIPGPWWLAEVREDYETLKNKFLTSLPSDIPAVCLEIMSDYEIRYNEIMFDQLEADILRIGRRDNESEEDAKENSICNADILDQNELKKESNNAQSSEESYEVSVKPDFEDIFLVKKNISTILTHNDKS